MSFPEPAVERDRHSPAQESRKAAELRVLASGVDALYLSGRCLVPHERWREFVALKERAAADLGEQHVALGGERFVVAATGLRRYPVRLEHEHALICVTDSASFPALWIQPRSEFLHAVGPQGCMAWLDSCLTPVFGVVKLAVSRIDIFVDWQGWCPVQSDGGHIVCRSRERRINEVHGRLTGFEFGRRKTGRTARMYDKTEEIRAKRRGQYWYAIWGEPFVDAEPVWRLEFEIGRQTLRDLGLSGPADVLAAVGDLWRYGSYDWLSLRDPTNDATRSRWPTAAVWTKLQAAGMRVAPLGLTRVRQAKRAASLAEVEQRVATALSSYGALLGAQTLGDVLLDVPRGVSSYELRTGRDFEQVLAQKRRELEF